MIQNQDRVKVKACQGRLGLFFGVLIANKRVVGTNGKEIHFLGFTWLILITNVPFSGLTVSLTLETGNGHVYASDV